MFNNFEIATLQGKVRYLESLVKEFQELRWELYRIGLLATVESGRSTPNFVGKVNMDKLLEALDLTLVKTDPTEKYVKISK